MHKKLMGYALVYAVLSSVLTSVYPVLDEESYLYIAQSMSVDRPYDWMLPWPPYTDSYRYAHPPLFLYWVWLGAGLFGSSIAWLKFFLGFPFRLLLGYTASWILLQHTSSSNQKWSILAWVSSPIVLMVGARSMMPDLMFSAFGMCAVMLYLSAQEEQKIQRFLCGMFLGFACWVKYPALLLWVPIVFSYRTWRGMWPIVAGFLCTWGFGEGQFLVVPFLGPRTSRHFFGTIVDIALNPVRYALKDEDTIVSFSPSIIYALSERSRNGDTIDNLRETSIDYYSTLRSIYLQSREINIIDNFEEDQDIFESDLEEFYESENENK